MTTKKGGFYAVTTNAWLRPLLKNPWIALFIHWFFQGLLYMDATERWFKLLIDISLWVLFTGLFGLFIPLPYAIVVAVMFAHTVNLVVNGQIWVVMKHFGSVRHTREEFGQEVERLSARIAREPEILYAAAYGSLARQDWSPTSDLDVRLVRAPGFIAAWRACWFTLSERARAFWARFPLDIYVLDSYRSLANLAEKDTPIVLGGSARANGEKLDGNL